MVRLGPSILKDQAPYAYHSEYCFEVGMDLFLHKRSENLYPTEFMKKICSVLLTLKVSLDFFSLPFRTPIRSTKKINEVRKCKGSTNNIS